jgi:hypothetical protein
MLAFLAMLLPVDWMADPVRLDPDGLAFAAGYVEK